MSKLRLLGHTTTACLFCSLDMHSSCSESLAGFFCVGDGEEESRRLSVFIVGH